MVVRRVPLVGRSAELEMLREDLARARAGQGAVRLIVGEPGIGKSFLVDALVDTATSAGFAVDRGWAAEHDRDRPFGLALEVFRSGSARDFAASRQAAGAGPDYAVVDGLLDIVESVTTRAPLLMVFEDLQWADALSVRFVATLGVRASTLPLLIVATMRSLPRSDVLKSAAIKLVEHGARIVEVDALNADDVAELAQHLLGEPPAGSLRDYLKGAAGNPLFVTELVAALGTQSSLQRGEAGVEALRPGLPPPLRLVILRRLDGLSAPVIDLLRLAAVLGSSFTAQDLSVVSRRSATDLLPMLDEALRAGVLVERLDCLAFRHDVLHESVYQDVPRSARRAVHREFADLLAAAGADRSAVAEHMARGAEPGDAAAVQWLVEAADTGPDLTHASVPYLERARALCRPESEQLPGILSKLALSYVFMGRPDDALAAARGALAGTPTPEVEAAARAALAAREVVSGRFRDGVAELVAISAVEEYPLGDRADALASAAYFSVFCSEPDNAISRANAALALIGGDDAMRGARSNAQQALALATMATGDARDALTLARKVRASDVPYPASEGVTFALVSMLCNDIEAARGAITEDLLALAGGNEGTRPILHFALAMVHYLEGNFDDAEAEAAAGQSLADELATGLARTFGRAIAALIAIHRGRLDDARAVLDLAVEEVARFGPQFGVDLLLLAQALHADATGNKDGRRMWLLGAWDLAGPMRAMSMSQVFVPQLLRALEPDAETSARVVSELFELAGRNPAPMPLGLARLGQAMLDDDADLALAAVRVHREGECAVPHAQVCEIAADILIGHHRMEEAADLLGRALDTWEVGDATREEARVTARLRSIGVRRRRSRTPTSVRLGWDALTSTELKVAALVADGLTRREIGARLFISRRTVETHLSHIFAKLGVSNRSQVAAFVAGR